MSNINVPTAVTRSATAAAALAAALAPAAPAGLAAEAEKAALKKRVVELEENEKRHELNIANLSSMVYTREHGFFRSRPLSTHQVASMSNVILDSVATRAPPELVDELKLLCELTTELKTQIKSEEKQE